MGQIKVEKNVGGIEGLCVIEPTVHGDSRGYFMVSRPAKNEKQLSRWESGVPPLKTARNSRIIRADHY